MKHSTEKSPKVKNVPNLIRSVMTASPFKTFLLVHKFDFGPLRYLGEKPVISQFRVQKVRKAQITNAKDETFN